MTKLEILLFKIDPAFTVNKADETAVRILESFSPTPSTVEDWEEFAGLLYEFCCHIEAELVGTAAEDYYGSAYMRGAPFRDLEQVYGDNGDELAFRMAKYGVEGGLYRLLKDLAVRKARKDVKSEIGYVIRNWLRELSDEEKLSAANEYLLRYRNLLPPEEEADDVMWVVWNLQEVLENHPFMIDRMRRFDRAHP